MIKKVFYSQLFQRNIAKTEKDYSAIVKAELLYRIQQLQSENCSCFQCQSDLEKYQDYYNKIIGKNEKKRSSKLGRTHHF